MIIEKCGNSVNFKFLKFSGSHVLIVVEKFQGGACRDTEDGKR